MKFIRMKLIKMRKKRIKRMPKGGLEPPRTVVHYPLKIACLPVPPLRLSSRRTIKKAVIDVNKKMMYILVFYKNPIQMGVKT